MTPSITVVLANGVLDVKGTGWIAGVNVAAHIQFFDADGNSLYESDGGGNKAKADGTFDWPIPVAWMGPALATYDIKVTQGGTVEATGAVTNP